jgi:hypothetical protein
LRNPSTGDSAQTTEGGRTPDPDDPGPGGQDRARDPRADTRRNVNGESAPRMPHERDESSDSGTGAPSEVVQKGHDDVVSGRTGTDKGEATDAVYERTLRDKTPGSERD